MIINLKIVLKLTESLVYWLITWKRTKENFCWQT